MNDIISKPDATAQQNFLLGEILGSRKAFSTVAGRASAAEADCLRRLRDEKLFRCKSETWGEFCATHLKMSKASANRIIRLLEEFGSDYFAMAQLTRVTPAQYRTIASSVKDHIVTYNGEAIALIPENTEKVATAVENLRKAAPAKSKAAARRARRPRSRRARIALLRETAEQLTAEFADLARTSLSRRDIPVLAEIRNTTLADLYAVDLLR
jgi:hypothetical protein